VLSHCPGVICGNSENHSQFIRISCSHVAKTGRFGEGESGTKWRVGLSMHCTGRSVSTSDQAQANKWSRLTPARMHPPEAVLAEGRFRRLRNGRAWRFFQFAPSFLEANGIPCADPYSLPPGMSAVMAGLACLRFRDFASMLLANRGVSCALWAEYARSCACFATSKGTPLFPRCSQYSGVVFRSKTLERASIFAVMAIVGIRRYASTGNLNCLTISEGSFHGNAKC
jgi:hypothetical protein